MQFTHHPICLLPLPSSHLIYHLSPVKPEAPDGLVPSDSPRNGLFMIRAFAHSFLPSWRNESVCPLPVFTYHLNPTLVLESSLTLSSFCDGSPTHRSPPTLLQTLSSMAVTGTSSLRLSPGEGSGHFWGPESVPSSTASCCLSVNMRKVDADPIINHGVLF